MIRHHKIEHMRHQRDLLSHAVQGVDQTLLEAREDLRSARDEMASLVQARVAEMDSSWIRCKAEIERQQARVDSLTASRDEMDRNRGQLGQTIDRLERYQRERAAEAIL